jgi:hypothetical protein
MGWYAERPTNGLAIASLVTSLSCLPPLGLLLGILGLRQIRRRGDRGRGLAVAGVVISSLGIVVIALFVTLGVAGAFEEGNTQVRDLKAGQCFNTVDHSLTDYGADGVRSTTVDVVPCGDPHDAEAYAVVPLDSGPDGGYPGLDAAAQDSSAMCATAADSYLGDNTSADGMDIFSYMPPEGAWNNGDRDVTCFFGSPSGKVTGPVMSGGQGAGVGV